MQPRLSFSKSPIDDLERAGAKFDLVDPITMHELEDMTLREVLLNAIID